MVQEDRVVQAGTQVQYAFSMRKGCIVSTHTLLSFRYWVSILIIKRLLRHGTTQLVQFPVTPSSPGRPRNSKSSSSQFSPFLLETMPTRIVANETDHSRKFGSFRLANNRNHLSLSATSVGSAISSGNGTNDCSITQRSLDSPLAKRKSSRKVVHLRSSIIRNKKGNQHLRALSSKDIRASPRLLGYCFQLLASIVMLISVSTFFYGEEKETSDEIGIIFNATDGVDSQKLYYSNESRAVFAWKLYGCFVVSGLGTIMSLVIILVHFDTIFFPTLWLHTFRDGSKREQVLLIALTIFWAVGLHFNTSSLSVGESQANVYFTTWISFFSAVLNYGIWRVSAGRTSIADLVNEHHRETTWVESGLGSSKIPKELSCPLLWTQWDPQMNM